jgi:predicted aspartyl protease
MKTIECGYSGQLAVSQLTTFGPTVLVDIGFDPAWQAGAIPTPGNRDVPALIDTGAQECFVDCDLANLLNLPMVDRREVAGSQGKHEVDVYLAQLHVRDLFFTMYGLFAGAYLHQGGMPYEALIGRTFLEHFSLVYDGRTGRVTLTG